MESLQVSKQIKALCEKVAPNPIDNIEFGEIIFEVRGGKVYRIKLIQSLLVHPEGEKNANK
jgi:hypothetical protein